VEAMSCGKPLVVTDAGGLGCLVDDRGGLRVPVVILSAWRTPSALSLPTPLDAKPWASTTAAACSKP
jgi:glycosyltransferase involved in cell wall biosynthesis